MQELVEVKFDSLSDTLLVARDPQRCFKLAEKPYICIGHYDPQ